MEVRRGGRGGRSGRVEEWKKWEERVKDYGLWIMNADYGLWIMDHIMNVHRIG